MSTSQFRTLYQDFLRRLIDIEILSTHARGDASTLFGQFTSLLVFLSFLFSVPALYFSGKMAVPGQAFLIGVWTLQHFLIATTMLLVGLFAVLTWNSTFPDKRDLMVLAPLPLRVRTIFLAKIAAAGTALGLLILVLHSLAGVVWPLAFNRHVPGQTLSEFKSESALPPVSAAGMQAVMNRELAPALASAAAAHAGLSIGVTTRGVRRVFAYGTAKPDSIFEIGSVTKIFTALALAQMAQQGLVKLDEPVRQLMPPGTVERPFGAEITLLDLATHHSGLPRMPSGFFQKNKDDPFADFAATDLYEYMSRQGVKKRADVSFSYSNLGLGLLGQVLADRARLSYAELIKTKITEPLGLPDTVVVLSPEQRSRLIQGYNGLSDGPDGFRRSSHAYGDPVPSTTFRAIAGAGALHSTAGDLLKFLEENLHPETYGRPLATALVESHRPRAPMDDSVAGAETIPAGTRIALIWWRTPDGCYLHGGAMPGYTASVLFNPKDDYAVVVLSNVGPGGILSSDLVAEHIRQRLMGLPALSLAPINIPESGGFLRLIRLFAVYWLTMLAAGGFIYCCILGLQGLAAQLFPRQWFLRVSTFLQMAVFCSLVSVYFLQPAIAQPNLLDVHSTGLPSWSPSYWFLGLFQQLNCSPALSWLASRAWFGLFIALGATAASYALCYLRSLRQIVEEPDILPVTRRASLLPRFGSHLQTAIVQFSVRTLLRSRQHRVILAFYLGIGFAATVLLLKSPVAREITGANLIDPWHAVNAPLLASSIILMGFWIVGMRTVFSLPLELAANWIFRVTPLHADSQCISTMRRSLWVLALVPAWLISAVVLLALWPWRAAAAHLLLLAFFGLIISELCLRGGQKIPFTCSWLPGKSNFHITFWVCIMLVLEIVLRAVEWERQALAQPAIYSVILGAFAIIFGLARWHTSRQAAGEPEPLQFDEVPSWQLVTLDLPKEVTPSELQSTH